MCASNIVIGSVVENDPLIKKSKEEREILDTIIAKRIMEIQNSCDHEMINSFKEEGELWNRKKILVSKACGKCGVKVEKPKGMPWKICEVCWSPMEDDGFSMQQGDRTHHYKCSSNTCSNTTFHT